MSLIIIQDKEPYPETQTIRVTQVDLQLLHEQYRHLVAKFWHPLLETGQEDEHLEGLINFLEAIFDQNEGNDEIEVEND